MPRRGSPLRELAAWLVGLILPVGGLATALALTLTGEPSPGAVTGSRSPTTLVAGASVSTSAQPVAATATPRDSLGGPLVTSPMAPAGTAPQPASELRPDVAVAGVQLQTSPPPQFQSARITATLAAPLLGRVGGYAVPTAIPATALLMTLAGLAWRVHTSARWPSKSARQPKPSSLPRTRSAPA